MWRDKLGAIAVKFRLTDSVHFEDRTVIYILDSTVVLCMEQIFHKSLSGAIPGSSVGMPSTSRLSCDAGAVWGGPLLWSFMVAFEAWPGTVDGEEEGCSWWE